MDHTIYGIPKRNSSKIQTRVYDMNGYYPESLEVGAPVLISKRPIDTEHYSAESDSETYADASDASYCTIPRRPTALEGVSHNKDDITQNPLKKSRSAQSIHKSELKIFLQKTPSLNLKRQPTIGVPHALNVKDVNENFDNHTTPTSDKSNNSFNGSNTAKNEENGKKQVGNTTSEMGIVRFECDGPQKQENSFENFNLMASNMESYDPRDMFVSDCEFSDAGSQAEQGQLDDESDFDYIKHRDKLKLSERRVTLMKNKTGPLINLERKREKLTHAWSGFKHWVDGERGRLKGVIQKHAATQRVGNYQPNSAGRSDQSNTSKKDSEDEIYAAPSLASSSTFVKEMSYDGSEANSETNRELHLLYKKTRYKDYYEGQNGFEELRRYIKQGSDFGKELSAILQERVESEQIYAKSLSKMASKLNKACREVPGSIVEAWRGIATEMENRSEIHRQFSTSLVDELVKPLKQILENQHKSRKSVESSVDKSWRILSEWRASEAKAKKVSHTAARENEKLQDAMLDVRIQRAPSVALLHHGLGGGNASGSKGGGEKEKDCAKLDNKRRKAEEAVKRADVQYYTLCIRAERARFDWEMSVLRGSSLLQSLENQRLINMKNYATAYLRLSSAMNPMLTSVIERLAPQVDACNVQKDLTVIQNIRRASEGPSEQLLPDFYCEHTTLAMNRERRKHALLKLIQLVKTDLERERKSKIGLKGLCQSLNTSDNSNFTEKLYNIRSMLTYLEGTRFKLQSALLELDQKPRTSHPLSPHIQITRDRTGLQQSILKVPLWLKSDDNFNDNLKMCDLEMESQLSQDCIDIKNETVIKNFDRCFSRSKSTSEIALKRDEQRKNAKALTMPTRDIENTGYDRGTADGVSSHIDSDFDEFSSQDEDDETTKKGKDASDGAVTVTANGNNLQNRTRIICRCKALYSYTPKLYDELELKPGDIIEVHAKQEDGWWLGALRNQSGLFPATYVEEII